MFPLEICIDSLDSAEAAEPYLRDGDRFEVCSSLLAAGGGLTPSIGLIRLLKAKIPHIKLMAMIRPRPGSFVYDKTELEVMLADIEAMKQAGVDGIVFGCLTPEGEVDLAISQRLATMASPLPVTFHRAFDITPSWGRALRDVASIKGVTRILTSGHAKTALEGADELANLIKFAPPHLTILPASGINASSLSALLPIGIREAHLSASGAVGPTYPGPAVDRGAQLGFGKEEWRLDVRKLEAVRDAVQRHVEA